MVGDKLVLQEKCLPTCPWLVSAFRIRWAARVSHPWTAGAPCIAWCCYVSPGTSLGMVDVREQAGAAGAQVALGAWSAKAFGIRLA
jgi:hypothetical protein